MSILDYNIERVRYCRENIKVVKYILNLKNNLDLYINTFYGDNVLKDFYEDNELTEISKLLL